MNTTKAEQQGQGVVMQTCGEDHVNEAKAQEESGGQEEVGLPDHQHHHVRQHGRAKHHAAHCHACHQHTYTHTSMLSCSKSGSGNRIAVSACLGCSQRDTEEFASLWKHVV